MTLSNVLGGAAVVAAIVIAALVPAFAFAQTTGTGVLTVYAQVNNPYGASATPGQFALTVSGQTPVPASFQGSQSGVLVSINTGAYSVAATGVLSGYAPSYSAGCTGTIAAGQTQTCVVTFTAQEYQYPYQTYPYGTNGYSYNYPPFTCSPAYQTAQAGQTVQFTAQGGIGGTYNWMTPERNYPNAGPVLSVLFTDAGSHLVTVTNATQVATCSVTITTNGGYFPNPTQPTHPTLPAYPSYQSGYPTYPTYPVVPAVSLTQYPRWPNTGVEPISGATAALAVLMLAAIAVIGAPYARKAFAIVSR